MIFDFKTEGRLHPLRPARGKEPGDRRSVGWTRSDLKKPDGARRIDKDIAAELTRIAVEVGGAGQSSSEQLLRVRPPRAWPPDVPPFAAEHAVPVVERPRLVDENGPPNTRSDCVRAGLRPALERHYDDADVEFLKHRFVLLQLQQMPTARQSAQMPVEDQQEPVPAVIVAVVEATFRIRQRKRHRRITDMCAHEDSSSYTRDHRPFNDQFRGPPLAPSARPEPGTRSSRACALLKRRKTETGDTSRNYARRPWRWKRVSCGAEPALTWSLGRDIPESCGSAE